MCPESSTRDADYLSLKTDNLTKYFMAVWLTRSDNNFFVYNNPPNTLFIGQKFPSCQLVIRPMIYCRN